MPDVGCQLVDGQMPAVEQSFNAYFWKKSICGCHDDHVCLCIGTLTVSDADRLNPEVGTLILCALCVAQHSSQVHI